MPQPLPTGWRARAIPAFVIASWCSVVYFLKFRQSAMKDGHDFVPIYGEDGKLEGFTHPTMVDAGNRKRELNGAKGSEIS